MRIDYVSFNFANAFSRFSAKRHVAKDEDLSKFYWLFHNMYSIDIHIHLKGSSAFLPFCLYMCPCVPVTERNKEYTTKFIFAKAIYFIFAHYNAN